MLLDIYIYLTHNHTVIIASGNNTTNILYRWHFEHNKSQDVHSISPFFSIEVCIITFITLENLMKI